MVEDFFKKNLTRTTIFEDESTLDINYVPSALPHRNKELSLLAQLFLPLITNKNGVSRKVIITGKTGVGKTATVRLFGELLKAAQEKEDIEGYNVYINCRKESSSYKILIKLNQAFRNSFPKRGYSPQDLLDILNETLDNDGVCLLIILDELDFLIKKDRDILYSLTHLNDSSFNAPQRVSIIGIVNNISCLNNLDAGTLSQFKRNNIKFKNYTKSQIFDILKYRTEMCIKGNFLSEEILENVSEVTFMKGDIRYGLTLLWKAGKIAEQKNLLEITDDCIQLANNDLMPFKAQDFLREMQSQKLLFLFSIIKAIKNSKEKISSLMEILKYYLEACENTGTKPRNYSQLWNYIQEYKKKNLISTIMQSKNIKGRKALFRLQDIPLKPFEKDIITLLKSRGMRL